jgi:hypothetical protein
MHLVASFCGYPNRNQCDQLAGARGDASRWAQLVERCSFAFMKQHAEQFDEGPVFQYCNPRMGLPVTARSVKVRAGADKQSTATLLTAKIIDKLNDRWQQVITSLRPDLPSYRDLLELLKQRHSIDYRYTDPIGTPTHTDSNESPTVQCFDTPDHTTKHAPSQPANE